MLLLEFWRILPAHKGIQPNPALFQNNSARLRWNSDESGSVLKEFWAIPPIADGILTSFCWFWRDFDPLHLLPMEFWPIRPSPGWILTNISWYFWNSEESCLLRRILLIPARPGGILTNSSHLGTWTNPTWSWNDSDHYHLKGILTNLACFRRISDQHNLVLKGFWPLSTAPKEFWPISKEFRPIRPGPQDIRSDPATPWGILKIIALFQSNPDQFHPLLKESCTVLSALVVTFIYFFAPAVIFSDKHSCVLFLKPACFLIVWSRGTLVPTHGLNS